MLLAGLTAVLMMLMAVGSALAAQGQITEVNPSGISVADSITDVGPPPCLAAQGQIVDVNPPGLSLADEITGLGSLISNRPPAGIVITTFPTKDFGSTER